MIVWFLCGFLAALYSVWDYFFRKPERTSTITRGELLVVNILMILLGPLSILYVIGFEVSNNETIKNWWNTKA